MTEQVTLTPAAARVLEVVEKLFYDNGIRAGGLDVIAAGAGRTEQVTVTPAAERGLEVVEKLFYDNGSHAVGVDMIAAEAGVTKKTLYDRFGSKDASVRLYLQRRDARWREHVTAVVERPGRLGPKRRILLMFDALESWMAAENPRGCAFVNALAELPDPAHPAREAIDDEKRWVLDYFRTL